MTAMKRVVIVGASGMVGGHALRYVLEDPAVGGVTSIGRKNLRVAHPRLTEILHADFTDCSPLADALTGHDAAVYCLGAYTGAVPDEELRRITVDYTIEFVRVLSTGEVDVERVKKAPRGLIRKQKRCSSVSFTTGDILVG